LPIMRRFCVCVCVCVLLGFEHRALLGRCCTSWATPPAMRLYTEMCCDLFPPQELRFRIKRTYLHSLISCLLTAANLS
jgi:hypothetical protein